jgi:Domain of unknown function (DUF4340)
VNRNLLTGLLVLLIQCGLVAIVYWPQIDTRALTVKQPMAPFEPANIDRISIGDEYDNETLLRRSGDRWILPELENLPADTDKINHLLDSIVSSDTTWPTADSTAARQRFQVASYHYQRRLELQAGDQTPSIVYLGTSPGFGKVHARNDTQDAIYSIALNTFDAPGNSGGWLDPKLLQIRTPLGITADSYSLQREGSNWISGIGRTPDERELLALLTTLRSMRVDGVADQDSQRELAGAEPELVLRVESLTGEVTLELFRHNDKHFIHSSEYPLFFTLSAYDFDRLTSIDFRLISGEQDSIPKAGTDPQP